MRFPAIVVAATGLAFLNSCAPVMQAATALSTAKTGYDLIDKVSTVADPIISEACKEYQIGRAAANARISAGLVPAPTSKLVASIHAFGDAACRDPNNPPPGNTIETVIWLGKLGGQVKTLVEPPKTASKS